MKPTSERFLQIVSSFGLKNRDFLQAKINKVSPNQISQVRQNNHDVSVTLIGALCEIEPSVNADYIINGRGGTLLTEIANKNPDRLLPGEEREVYKKQIEERDKKIQELERELLSVKTLLSRQNLS